jgi:hypothetical protein
MTRRTSAVGRFTRTRALVLLLVVLGAACGVDSSSKEAPAVAPVLKAGTADGAMADLQASPQWTKPRCRWLETGTWILAYRQETALYEAARDLGYIELAPVGTANRTGTPETAWKVTLTEAGKAQAAACGSGSSRPSVWGLPVSARRFIAGKRVKEPDMFNPDRTIFDVEFEWIPTAAGERVKHVLTDKMAVEQGLAHVQVSLKYGDRLITKGAHGWWVERMDDAFVAPQ